MLTTIRPLAPFVAVRVCEGADTTPGGLYYPETAKRQQTEAIVVATFEGSCLRVGDRVVYRPYKGEPWGDDLLIPEEQILGVVTP